MFRSTNDTYIPHSEQDIKEMSKSIGISSIDELFTDIPENIRLKNEMNLPNSKSEVEVIHELKQLAEANISKVLFAGGGIYDHIIPSIVGHLSSRSEFVTAYTPYQPELSQGMLQALFEFQSAIAEITGLPVSNSSMYDGYTAAAEACLMALNSTPKTNIILLASTVHPSTKKIFETFFNKFGNQNRILKRRFRCYQKRNLKGSYGKECFCRCRSASSGLLIYTELVENPGRLGLEILHAHKAKFFYFSRQIPLFFGVLLKPQGRNGGRRIGRSGEQKAL